MKKLLLSLTLLAGLIGLALAAETVTSQPASTPAQEVSNEIGAPVQEKSSIIAVKEVSRVWRVQADANGQVTVFFETVAVFPDGREVQLSTKSVSRPVAAAAEQFSALEKLARGWLDEDATAAANPPAPAPGG